MKISHYQPRRIIRRTIEEATLASFPTINDAIAYDPTPIPIEDVPHVAEKLATTASTATQLYRIYALRRHPRWQVRVGEQGGFITPGVHIDNGCWIDDDAALCNSAQLYDETYLGGRAVVAGAAGCQDHVYIDGDAFVHERAMLKYMVRVKDNAEIRGDAVIDQYATLYGNCCIEGAPLIEGHARIGGNAHIADNPHIFGRAHILGESICCGPMSVFGTATLNPPTPTRFTQHFSSGTHVNNKP